MMIRDLVALLMGLEEKYLKKRPMAYSSIKKKTCK
jgi:hypothetical protein